jgi:hypothetical protein
MSVVLAIAIVLCLFLAGMFVLVFRKLGSSAQLPAEQDWVEQATPDRYRPMERLLTDLDFRRLQGHPAIGPKMLRRFRAQRVRVFRGYLDCLSLDFSRVCQAVKLLMVQSAEDRPDLATLLVKQRLTFAFQLMVAQCCLTGYVLGVGKVEVRPLVAALDSMRLELNSLMLASELAGA